MRLALRKPMGIVFEPMTDPHNPSQQRGVRICDLPRTGAAAMSQKLEVGDELLSINDKTMSRLTFDEIMDFIIEADKDRVDLLFCRPGKDRLGRGSAAPCGPDDPTTPAAPNAAAAHTGKPALSPTGLGGLGSHSNSVKWIDERSEAGGGRKPTEDPREPDRERRGGGTPPGAAPVRRSRRARTTPAWTTPTPTGTPRRARASTPWRPTRRIAALSGGGGPVRAATTRTPPPRARQTKFVQPMVCALHALADARNIPLLGVVNTPFHEAVACSGHGHPLNSKSLCVIIRCR